MRVPFAPYPTPLHDASGELGGAVYMLGDISSRMDAAARQRLLINELNHRVKNSLASAQSIVTQTLRSAGDLDTARKTAEQRLMALARAHDLLAQESWRSARMDDVVLSSLAGYGGDAERLHVEGPAVQLTPKMALALAMAIHELSVNASKYGALSQPSGRVRITWQVEQADDARRLRLDWREAGGPAVAAPTHRGFGVRPRRVGPGRRTGWRGAAPAFRSMG